MKVLENPVWPFEDLGEGIFHLRLRSAGIFVGIIIVLATGAAACYFFIFAGVFSFPVCVCIIFLFCGVMAVLGKLTTQELIIGRDTGYILRLEATRKVIVEQDIYNIYVRLQKKTDSVQVEHYYLIIGGYLLDDIRISRMTHNEGVMRVLGKYLARNLGINYFDYHDETINHSVIHFRNPSDEIKLGATDLDVLFSHKPHFHTESETQLDGVVDRRKRRMSLGVEQEELHEKSRRRLQSRKSKVRVYKKDDTKSIFPGHVKRKPKFGLHESRSRKSVFQSLADQITFRRRKHP